MTELVEITCDERLTLAALRGIPVVDQGDDLAEIILQGLARERLELRSGDVLVVASKLVSRIEGRFVDLSALEPSPRALALSSRVGLDARLVELVLAESLEISRTAPGVLVVKNRLGVVCANAGVDLSNARPLNALEGTGPWALRLPESPDASAQRLRDGLVRRTETAPGVIISDSIGRPFRLGSVGVAIGLAGFPAMFDQRGQFDLFGRPLEHTLTALADQVAGATDLIAGQGAEGRGVVLVRGLRFPESTQSARELLRPPEQDLYAAPVDARGSAREQGSEKS